VTAETTDILIESAYFDPSTIRRTAKALDVQTDSSYRFERGVDRDGQVWAAARAARLIATLGGGTVVPGRVDAHPDLPDPQTVTLRPDRLRGVLGVDVPTDTATRLLTAIGFEIDETEDGLHCTVPTWRPDVSIEEDLIEEVARLHGYDQIPEPERVPVPGRTPDQRPAEVLERKTRELLRGRGCREIYTNSMLRADRAERFNVPPAGSETGPVVETKNPISEEMAALRPRLLPGALTVMRHNRNHGQDALHLFEFGRVYRRALDGEEPLVPGYAEHPALLIALSGPHAPVGWDTDPRDTDLFDLKGLVETLLDDLRVPDVRLTPRDAAADADAAITQHQIDVTSGGTPLGTLARVRDDVAADFDLDEHPVVVAEFHWGRLADRAATGLHRTYEPVSRFPVVDRDLAVLVHAGQPVGPMQDTIRETGAPLLRRVDVFDVYEGEGIDEDAKSVAFTLRFGADRTLTDEEVDDQIEQIVDALARQHDATLRQ
jgi:phenylalanyl-tRNA synthetase beta chain